MSIDFRFKWVCRNGWKDTKWGFWDVRPPGIWDDFYVADEGLVTGTNPQSAKSTAYAAVTAFDAFVKADRELGGCREIYHPEFGVLDRTS